MPNQKKLYCHHRSSREGNAIKNLTPQFGLQQIIKEPTHVSNTSSSCIDIITTSQPNWMIGCPVYTLHCIQIAMFLQNWTYMLHILHHIYVRSSTTEKQTQGLLDVPSKNLMDFKRKNLQRISPRVPSTFSLVQKTLFLL